MKFLKSVMLLGLITVFITACSTLSDISDKVGDTFKTHRHSFNDTAYEIKSCEITTDRSAICKFIVTNQFTNKLIEIPNRAIKIQDDLGNDYTVSEGGFGETTSVASGHWRKTVIADSSYQLSVVATNLSTKAKSIKAVIFSRLLVRSNVGKTLGYRDQAIFTNPPMVKSQAKSQQPATIADNSSNNECVSQSPGGGFDQGLVNIATSGTASQSSTGRFTWDAVASFANDGNRDGNYKGKSVAHTLSSQGAWWQVDLGQSQDIEKIVIWNRTDGGWGKRLSNFNLVVLNDSNKEVYKKTFCANGGSFNPAMVVEIPGNLVGRYVKISLNGNNYLQLAEVEVFASESSSSIGNTVVEQPVAVAAVKSLVGCWRWSNEMLIVVKEGGQASNGFATGPWAFKGGNRFAIDWPDLTGTVELSADGKSLNSQDSFGTHSTAQRLKGLPSGFEGEWRWDNGAVVIVTADRFISVGNLRGTWTGSGRSYGIVWPVVDNIIITSDGKSLSGQNLFGAFTAKKQPNC